MMSAATASTATLDEVSTPETDVIVYQNQTGFDVVTNPIVNQQGWMYRAGSTIRVPCIYGEDGWFVNFSDDF